MPSLTNVFVAVLPDTSAFGRQLTTQLRRIDASSSGKQIGGTLAKGLIGAMAGIGVGNLLKGFITDAAEAAKLTRITENTIESMGNVAGVSADQITTLAGSLATKTGVDDAAIQAGENLLLTFGKVRDEVGKGNDIFTQATRLGLDMSVALGTDASGAALQLGKALNDPVKGIGALSRAGVSFTAEQKEQIKTLVETGDTLGAQKVILGELEKQFGGTAAAAADPMAQLSFVVGELGESVGTLLLPAVRSFATYAGGTLVPAIQGMVDGFKSGEGAAGFLATIFDKLRDASDVLVPLTAGIAAFIVTFKVMNATVAAYKAVQQAYAFWTYSQAAATGVFATALHALKAAFLANPIGIVVALLVGLGVALVVAYKKSETFRDIVNGAWAAIKNTAAPVVEWFVGTALPWLQKVFQDIGDKATWLWRNVLAPAFDGIRVAFGVATTIIEGYWSNILRPMFDAYAAVVGFLWRNVLVPAFDGIKRAFELYMGGVVAVWTHVVSPMLGAFGRGVDGLRAIFVAVVGAIGATWDTLKDKLRTPIKVAFEFVNDNVIDPMNLILDKFPGGIDIPSLPQLAQGGPVKGPGGPRSDAVMAMLSNGEYVVNARDAKRHRRLLEDINRGRIQDETGGPVGDVFETLKGAASSVTGFASDMLAKGARKAAEFLLNPIRDRLFALIGGDNVAAAVLRGGMEKLFAAVLAKGDEQDKVQKAAAATGGTTAFPGGGSAANLIAFGRLMQSMGARASEHPAFGGVQGKHANGSNHYIGRAIDLNFGPGGENAIEKAFFDRVLAQGLPRQYGLRSIWRAPGHFNHMHVDYDQGGWLMPGATGVNRGARPERVLTAAQTDSFDRLVKLLERGQGTTGKPPLVVNAYGAREDVLAERVIEGLRRRDALYGMG